MEGLQTWRGYLQAGSPTDCLCVKHWSAEGAEEVCEARMETSHGAQGLLTEIPWQVTAEMCHVAFTPK